MAMTNHRAQTPQRAVPPAIGPQVARRITQRLGRRGCHTCRMIRRFVLTLGASGLVLVHVTKTLPAGTTDTSLWRGLMAAAMLCLAAGIVLRLREAAARSRRRR